MKVSTTTLALLFFVAVGCATPDDVPAQTTDATGTEITVPPRGNDEARASSNAAVSQTIGTTNVTVTYGRPHVRDRAIYGDLVPYGQIWRAGANEATTITFSDDVTVAGEDLAAGTYALFATPNEDSWTLHFNSVAEQWGAYNYNASNDVLTVTVTPQEAPAQEMLTYSFQDVTNTEGTLVLHWADVMVPVTIGAK